jgi:hypothetical protein
MQVWRLAWAVKSYEEILKQTTFEEVPIWDEAIRQLKWAANYLQKIHFQEGTELDTLVIQVGELNLDHDIVVGRPISAEALSTPAARAKFNTSRPVYVLNNKAQGSDLLAEACSAFAAMSYLFETHDPSLSVELSRHALAAYNQLKTWFKVRPTLCIRHR